MCPITYAKLNNAVLLENELRLNDTLNNPICQKHFGNKAFR